MSISNFEGQILKEFGFSVQIGLELEFYLDSAFEGGEPASDESEFLAMIMLGVKQSCGVDLHSIGAEIAKGQYEVSLPPLPPEEALQAGNMLKQIVAKVADKYGKKVIFEAKPFDDLPGCGLHVHISLHDESNGGVNVFMRKSSGQGGYADESEELLCSVGGLCAAMLKDFAIFAPHEDSYKRFVVDVNSPFNNVPVNVSWGGNNRTTAIRIPASTIDENKRHIEHRVAGVDADMELVLEKIIQAIYVGLRDNINPPEKIYGNAYNEQYSFLEPFPKSLSLALNILNKEL